MTRATIIVPTFNHVDLLFSFLFNALQFIGPHDLLIVDNASTDETHPFLESMKKQGKNFRYVTAPRNLGFSGGNNYGLRYLPSDVKTVIFTSNDVQGTGDWITPICDALDANPKQLVGKEWHVADTGWNRFKKPDGDYITIPYIQGWLVGLHRTALKDLGGMELWPSECFPSDYEDLWLSYKASLAGYKLSILPELPVEHVGSGHTANEVPGGRLAVTLRNRERFMQKWQFSL